MDIWLFNPEYTSVLKAQSPLSHDNVFPTTNKNKQTNFYLRSDNNMLHMSRYNMHNNISYRGGCAKK